MLTSKEVLSCNAKRGGGHNAIRPRNYARSPLRNRTTLPPEWVQNGPEGLEHAADLRSNDRPIGPLVPNQRRGFRVRRHDGKLHGSRCSRVYLLSQASREAALEEIQVGGGRSSLAGTAAAHL